MGENGSGKDNDRAEKTSLTCVLPARGDTLASKRQRIKNAKRITLNAANYESFMMTAARKS